MSEKEIALALNNISMKYHVQSENEKLASKRSFLGRIKGRLTGAKTRVTVEALKPLSLVFYQGETVGLIGRNGSGKSTISKIICGQLTPTTGEVFASDTPIMLGVNASLVSELTGAQNIRLGCLAMGMSHSEIDVKLQDLIDLTGLGEAIHLPMKTYSAGMSARLRFAIATSMDPEILVIDEALNTGDAQFRDRSNERMKELRRNAGMVLLVSHSLSTIKQMSNRVVWLDKGTLIMDGDPETVAGNYDRYMKLLRAKKTASARKIMTQSMATLPSLEFVGEEKARYRLRRARLTDGMAAYK